MENLSVCVLSYDRYPVVPLVGHEGHPDEPDHAGDSRHYLRHAGPSDGCRAVDAIRRQHRLLNTLRLHFDAAIGVHDPVIGGAAILSGVNAERTPTPHGSRNRRSLWFWVIGPQHRAKLSNTERPFDNQYSKRSEIVECRRTFDNQASKRSKIVECSEDIRQFPPQRVVVI